MNMNLGAAKETCNRSYMFDTLSGVDVFIQVILIEHKELPTIVCSNIC